VCGFVLYMSRVQSHGPICRSVELACLHNRHDVSQTPQRYHVSLYTMFYDTFDAFCRHFFLEVLQCLDIAAEGGGGGGGVAAMLAQFGFRQILIPLCTTLMQL
jgi:hypothetical protein